MQALFHRESRHDLQRFEDIASHLRDRALLITYPSLSVSCHGMVNGQHAISQPTSAATIHASRLPKQHTIYMMQTCQDRSLVVLMTL